MNNLRYEQLEGATLQQPSKSDFLRKMIGDTVLVLSEYGDWHGSVSSVVNDETVVVIDSDGNPQKVDIFKLRSI